jgi:MinD-like ATPase involved in chromosome partitioning or flagellar assembly
MSASVGVLLATDGMPGDANLLAVLDARGAPTRVARRCVDVVELEAVAATRVATVAVVSAALRRFDADVVARLGVHGVHVVVLAVTPVELPGAAAVLVGALDVDRVCGAVLAADAGVPPVVRGRALAEPRGTPTAPEPDHTVLDGSVDLDAVLRAAPLRSTVLRDGEVVAVWGPVGSPGRTTVAVGVATEAARKGIDVLLIDADTYGASIAQVLGLLDESSGVAAACRHANAGRLDVVALTRCARQVPGVENLRVLSGIPRADRWPEVTGVTFEEVLGVARGCADLVIVDCGFSLEEDEELMLDSLAPRRNAATLVAIECADRVVVVGAGDPVSVQRLVRGVGALRDAFPALHPVLVLNRVPPTRSAEPIDVLQRHTGLLTQVVVPPDPAVADASARGLTVREVAARSTVVAAFAQIAALVVGASSTGAAAASASSSGRRPGGFWERIWKVPTRPMRRNAEPTQVAKRVDSA